MIEAMNATKAVTELDGGAVDIVYVVGGFGASVNLETPVVHAAIAAAYAAASS